MSSLSPVDHEPAELGVDLDALADFVRAAGPVAVAHVETTGLTSDPAAEVVEIGAALLDPGSGVVRTLASAIRPSGSIPRAASRLSGLSEEDLAFAPHPEEIAGEVERWLAGRLLVAHNAAFVQPFLARLSPVLREDRALDSQDLLAIAHPDAPDLRLETFAPELRRGEARHSALDTALALLRLLSSAAVAARAGERRYAVARGALESFAEGSPWLPLLDAEGLPPADETPVFNVPIPRGDEPPVPFDEDAIASVLEDEERGRRWFPGYRVRSQQVEMARAFVRLLADGGSLLLEGGTGVGKSLAYLAASIPFAMERAEQGVKDPVVISTRTKLLQDQLLAKDIPAAAAMLGYPELRAMSMKGRANYVCGRRLATVLAEGREPRLLAEDRVAFAALAACAKLRRNGEVGTLPAALLYRFPPLRDLVRRSVAARAEQCTREQCASERGCPFGRRRAALGKAQLVVTNHDLLLRWPPDFPRYAHAIVDEAHELAGVVDEVFAVEVRPDELLERVDELFGRSDVRARERALFGGKPAPDRSADTRELRRVLRQDLVALGRELSHATSEYGEIQLPAQAETIFPDAAELARHAAARLDELAAEADTREEERSPEEEDERAVAVARATGELRAAATALRGAFAEDDHDHVAAFEGLSSPYDRWRLAVRAVAPARAFHERFSSQLDSFACVSATLFVGGDSFAALGELELDTSELPPGELSLESPFPYPKHMRVVALEGDDDLVEATAAVLADVTRLLGGRTLGLFASLRRMRAVAKRLNAELRPEGYDVLMARRATDDPAALVERFRRAGSGGVLLGSRTYWQGLDIPGDALQAVVIEKLPFEVPNELRKRREARIRAQGDNAFARYSVGKMLLNLKQMIGRLIRTEEDRGLVVLVEGRTDRPYFRRLSEALPSGCDVRVASREALPEVLAELGIVPPRNC